MKRIGLFSASTKSDEDLKKTPLAQTAGYLSDIDVLMLGKNTQHLAKIYNEAIKRHQNLNYDYLVLVHDDVWVNCRDLAYRITSCLEKYQVFGIAGASGWAMKEPALWHLMGQPDHMHGCVAHGTPKRYVYTCYGSMPAQVGIIDGVMMGLNLKTLPPNIRFDESCPSKFHYYDLLFSMECYLAGVKIGIADIPVIHRSGGLSSAHSEWKAGQAYFLSKYAEFKDQILSISAESAE